MTVSKAQVDDFLEDIGEILKEDNLTREVDDKKGTSRTNVVYLNTDCNLRCEYCYEKDSREGLPDKTCLTTKMIDGYLAEIVSRETINSCVVIMGGEPTLRWNLYEYFIHKAAEMKKPGGWAIPITTNGVLLANPDFVKKIKNLMKFAEENKIVMDVEISWDGSGQYRRKFPDGRTSEVVVRRAIQNMIDANLPFCLSYTVHKGNYKDNVLNIVKDCIEILENWSDKGLTALSIGWAYQELDNEYKTHYAKELKDKLQPYAEKLFDTYGIPICGLTCGYCLECDKSRSVGNSYLSPTTGISYDEQVTDHGFQQF